MNKIFLLGFLLFCSISLQAKAQITPPTETLAVKSALQSAMWGLDIKIKELAPKCDNYNIKNINLLNYDRFIYNNIWHSRWSEIWTINACNNDIKLKFNFLQNDNDESSCKIEKL